MCNKLILRCAYLQNIQASNFLVFRLSLLDKLTLLYPRFIYFFPCKRSADKTQQKFLFLPISSHSYNIWIIFIYFRSINIIKLFSGLINLTKY